MVLLWMSNPQQLSFTTSMLSSQPGRISNAATARISFACSPFRAATMCCASDSVRGHTHARALAAPELSGLWTARVIPIFIPRCGARRHVHSCRNRHCPKCQAQARQRWLTRREQDLLPVPYFHVVFTLPHALNPLCQRHPRLLYDLLFRATAQTMLEVAADPRHLGARIGFLSIMHTWGQNLRLHPHLHCVIPASGFDPGYSHSVHPRYAFFLPVKVLSRVFRGKYLALLQRALRQRGIDCPSTLVRALLKDDWV